jgi:transcriptional regulator with XRE-family HTH domain
VLGDADSVFFTELGRELARLRHACGLTQARLADQLGVAVQTISRIEAGRVRVSLARARQWAAAVGVPLAEILAAAEGGEVEDQDLDVLRLMTLWKTLSPANQELGLGLLEQLRDRQGR